jgi:hypothetical protein
METRVLLRDDKRRSHQLRAQRFGVNSITLPKRAAARMMARWPDAVNAAAAGPSLPFPEGTTQDLGLSIVRWVTEIHGAGPAL